MKQKNNSYAWIVSIILILMFTILSCPQEEVSYTLTILHTGNGTTDPDGEIIVNQGEPINSIYIESKCG